MALIWDEIHGFRYCFYFSKADSIWFIVAVNMHNFVSIGRTETMNTDDESLFPLFSSCRLGILGFFIAKPDFGQDERTDDNLF